MKGINWIKDLQHFQFQHHHHNSQNCSIQIYSLKDNQSVRFMTYIFPLEDEISDIQFIKNQLDIYKNICSRYLAKISHATLLNKKQGQKLVLMHQISKAVSIFHGERNDLIEIIQDMISVLKGINKLHSNGFFNCLISKANIMRKAKGVYLGFPLFNQLFKLKRDYHENNQQFQLDKRASQAQDMKKFANHMQAALKQLKDCKINQQILIKVNVHLQKLIYQLNNLNIELIQVYKQMKNMISTIKVQFNINFNIFHEIYQERIDHNPFWERVCTQYIQEHFEVAIKYSTDQIKIELTSQKIPLLWFETIINHFNFHYQHIQSISQLYSILVSKSCKINIDSSGWINFMVSYNKKSLHQSFRSGKSKLLEIGLQNRPNKQHFIELLLNIIEQDPNNAISRSDLKQKMKEQIKYLLNSQDSQKISKQFQRQTNLRLKKME